MKKILPLFIFRLLFLYSCFFINLIPVFMGSKVFAQSACPAVSVTPSSVSTCGGCTPLTANVQGTVATTSYSVSSIPYVPFSYSTGTPVLVNIDDQWSSVITLPFCFQFFGNTYTQLVIGSNEIMSFDLTQAGGYCPYPLNGTPIPTNTLPMNSIMGPYQDIDPTHMGNIYWQILGTAPCRTFVVSFYHTPYYGDPNSFYPGFCSNPIFATSQIVFYETTNIIDINIQDKPDCTGWNGGYGIEGIQNATGTMAVAVPGRNNTVWTATNDAYRFTPTGAPQYALTWYDPSNTAIGTTPTISVCPTVNSTYTATVVNNTCNGPITVSAQVTVSINPNPTPTITASGSTTICSGGSVTLDAGAGYSNYSWSNGASTQTINVTTSGTYSVTVTDVHGCIGTSITSVIVTVNPNPTPTITASGPTTFCLGGSVTLDAGAGYSNYSWSNGASTQTINVTTAGTYSVTVTDVHGCIGTSATPITVTLNPGPAPTITASGSTTFCFGGSVTLDAGAGYSNYSWSNGASTQTINVTTAGTYSVTVTDVNGCIGTSATPITVTVNPSPTPTITTSGSTALCSGGSVTLNAGAGYSNYSWSNGASTQTINVTTAGTYSVTVTDVHGCIGTSTTSVIVTVNPNPTPTITASGPTTFCSGGNVTLNAGSGYSSYSWSNGGTLQTINVTTAGTYSVTVTDVHGCSGSASISVSLNPLPAANTSAVILSTANCGINTGSVTGITITSGLPPYTYVWHNSSGAVVGNGSLNLTNVGIGAYSLTITDANGCSTIVGPFIVTLGAGVTAAFTPNPVTGETPLTVNFTNSSIGATGYLWRFGTGDSSSIMNPTYVYVPLGSFKVCLIAHNAIGCYDTVCSTIDIAINSIFIIPNIFTPNADGVNDIFTVIERGLKTLDAEIYNRWGQKLYEWHTINGGWNGYTASGVAAPDGTYYYIIKAAMIDGKNYSEKGSFSLIR